jgi:hypothetical protein
VISRRETRKIESPPHESPALECHGNALEIDVEVAPGTIFESDFHASPSAFSRQVRQERDGRSVIPERDRGRHQTPAAFFPSLTEGGLGVFRFLDGCAQSLQNREERLGPRP